MTWKLKESYHIDREMLRSPIIMLTLALFSFMLALITTNACPNHEHDFREEGFSVVTISVHSSVRWITSDRSKFLGITVSSSRDQGAVEISKQLLIKSSVTVCSKCRLATGMVFMTLDQLKLVTALQPALQPLLSKAIAGQ